MSHTTMRVRNPRGTGRARSWAALLLSVGAAAAGWLILARDIDWPERNRAERARGRAAEARADYPLARARYEAALAANPYDWESRLRLANLLNHRLLDRSGALRHYLYTLAHSPDPSIVDETESRIRILRLIRSGELEDPLNALEDMLAAADAGAKALFLDRLEGGPLAGGDRYWEAWRSRGRGDVRLSRVEGGRDGVYDAMLELDYPGGLTMSMRFRSPLRDVWKLTLSFP